jgi:hypothetical protein
MPPKKKMTAEHKDALAKGREESRAVAAYLEALEANRPKRGRKRTPESIEKRVAAIEEQLPAATSIRALNMIQERLDLLDELDRINDTVDISPLRRGFVRVAKKYSQRKGITYTAWREIGVEADVLREAGITRGSA